MATYAETKQYLLDAYPSLFVDETDVLHHLFFVNGNGYEWHDGQLIDVCDPNEDLDTVRVRDQRYFRLEAKKAAEGGRGHMIAYFEEQIALLDKSPAEQREVEQQRRIKDCTRRRRPPGCRILEAYRLDVHGNLQHYLYPLCKYADILHIPDDVCSDWFEAAERALALVGGPLIHQESDRQENEKWLRRAERRIEEIREAWHDKAADREVGQGV